MIARLICLLKGHAYTPKDVIAFEYAKVTLETCDRCGKGERDRAFAEVQAAVFKAGRPR